MIDYLHSLLEWLNRRTFLLLTRLQNVTTDYSSIESYVEVKIIYLEGLLGKIQELTLDPSLNSEKYLRQHLIKARGLVRDVARIETSILPLMEAWSESSEHLQTLVASIFDESNLPYSSIRPVVSWNSSDYFYLSDQDIIYIPRLEAHSLLHIADLYHEVAHFLLRYNNHVLLLNYNEKVRDYYDKVYAIENLAHSPIASGNILGILSDSWQKSWIEEFACDMIAAYLVGPAYAMAHFHLCASRASIMYFPNTQAIKDKSWDVVFSHPADQARWAAISLVLNDMGWSEELENANSKWNSLVDTLGDKRPSDFDYVYPPKLLKNLQVRVREDLSNLGVSLYSKEKAGHNLKPFANKLNTAWSVFWAAPKDFSRWESENWTLFASAMPN